MFHKIDDLTLEIEFSWSGITRLKITAVSKNSVLDKVGNIRLRLGMIFNYKSLNWLVKLKKNIQNEGVFAEN